MKHLKKLVNLTELNLSKTHLTLEELKQFRYENFENLQELTIGIDLII